jgi:hypothetical protein
MLAFLLQCSLALLFVGRAIAGSAVPTYSIDTYELYNDRGNLSIVCGDGKVYMVLTTPISWIPGAVSGRAGWYSRIDNPQRVR